MANQAALSAHPEVGVLDDDERMLGVRYDGGGMGDTALGFGDIRWTTRLFQGFRTSDARMDDGELVAANDPFSTTDSMAIFWKLFLLQKLIRWCSSNFLS